MSEEHGQIVAHYTSAEALLKILDTKALWASDARYLNDTAEVIEGVNLADSRLALRFNGVDHADLPYLEHMKKEATDAFTFSLPLVACFSRDIDSLAQWRGYGNHSVAVALEFNEDELRALLESKHTILADCLYQEDRQAALLDDVIEQTLTTLRRKGAVPRHDEIGRWMKHPYMERKYPEYAELLRQVREAHTTGKRACQKFCVRGGFHGRELVNRSPYRIAN
jgi:hypothetical protein